MPTLFFDASAFVALADRDDHHHARALHVLEQVDPTWTLHTSVDVIDETTTRLRRKMSVATAVRFAESILDHPAYLIHPTPPDLAREAVHVMKTWPNIPFSFTDCLIVALMHRLALHDLFTFDRDVTATGLRVVPSSKSPAL